MVLELHEPLQSLCDDIVTWANNMEPHGGQDFLFRQEFIERFSHAFGQYMEDLEARGRADLARKIDYIYHNTIGSIGMLDKFCQDPDCFGQPLQWPSVHQTLLEHIEHLVFFLEVVLLYLYCSTVQRTHSPDFRTVNWFGQLYEFSYRQAKIVRPLWEAYDKGLTGLSQAVIAEEIAPNFSSFRVDHEFRNPDRTTMHPAWGTMIQRVGRGMIGLVGPTERLEANRHKSTHKR